MTIAAALTGLALISGIRQEAPPPTACVAPQVPAVERPVKPQRPALPSCVNEAMRRHTCSNRVINAYDAAMTAYGAAFEAHVAELNAYVKKLSEYTTAAVEYGQCEQRAVMPSALIEG